MASLKKAHGMLALTTAAFVLCFAVWMLNGVLVTYLVAQGVFDWSPVEVGWLIGIPVLTGAVTRLPLGVLTDRYGGKPVMVGVLLACALPLALLSLANSYWTFVLCSLGFGIAGGAFAVGIAFVSLWYPKEWQGRALGIFGAGNAGAAITTLLAPIVLEMLTDGGANIDGWRTLPLFYSGAMIVAAISFGVLARNKKPPSSDRTLAASLAPLRNLRAWRFGLYYFLVFGCFVAFAQWLVPYFVNSYFLSLVTAGILASAFSLPSGLIRAFGGWLSDKWGARKVTYWVLSLSVLLSFLLIFPRMIIRTPGEGVMAAEGGTVEAVEDERIVVGGRAYELRTSERKFDLLPGEEQTLVWPIKDVWQQPVVDVGDEVEKQQLLARGQTQIYFQANIWIAVVLIVLIGSVWGVGKASVYKYIPDYFPDQVGVVGGMVGVLGGLGGFVCPIIFGYLLEWTGTWTSCWVFIFFLSVACLAWLHSVVSRIEEERHVRVSEQPLTEARA